MNERQVDGGACEVAMCLNVLQCVFIAVCMLRVLECGFVDITYLSLIGC